MNIKKTIAGGTSVAILALGLAVIPAIGASAHTYGAEADCETGLTINLSNYHDTIPGKDAVPGTPAIPGEHHDAVGEPTITVDNPDYVPAQDAVLTTYVQEWLYVQHKTGKTSWHEEGWNGIVHGVDHGKGWAYAQPEQHRDSDVVLVQGHDAIPAVGEPTIQIPNPDYKPAYDDPETPAVPGQDAVPEQANHLTVLQDGESLIDTDFGSAFHENWPNPDKTVGHTWDVTVTSLDGIGAFHKVLTVDACEVVTPPEPGAANPSAEIQQTCGAAEITLTNDGENILTASFVVYVDGDFYNAYAVAAGDHQKVGLTFPEDSGDHQVVVRSGAAQGDEELASATVKSDCQPAVVTPPKTPAPAPAPAPQKPSQPVAPAAAPAAATPISLSAEDTLAQTGSNSDLRVAGLAGGLLLIGVASVGIAYAIRRRNERRVEQE